MIVDFNQGTIKTKDGLVLQLPIQYFNFKNEEDTEVLLTYLKTMMNSERGVIIPNNKDFTINESKSMPEKKRYSKLFVDQGYSIDKAVEFESICPGFFTGKSLSLILNIVGTCLNNPEIPIPLNSFFKKETYRLQGGELEHLKKVIAKLELKYLEFDKYDIYLTYKPYGYAQLKWVGEDND